MLADLFIESHEPLFLNDGPFPAEQTIAEMETLRSRVSNKDAKRLDWDIRLMKAGIRGEKRIAFELQNSHYPLVFIHDLNLEHEGAKAQIDFLVLSPFLTYVIECKNLYGNIEIHKDGSFVRTTGSGYRKHREGIYSPITQNARHIELLRAINLSGGSKLRKLMYRLFEQGLGFYRPLVVLANDKTIVSMKTAPQDIRSQVIRCDQLIEYIKQQDKIALRTMAGSRFDEIKKDAEYWLSLNKHVDGDLAGKYELKPEASPRPMAPAPLSQGTKASDAPQAAQATNTQPGSTPPCPLCGSPMELRIARHGKRKGKQFWGCSNYWSTGCRGIINIGE